ncbi:helix-turn-helix domain-containing protein [Oceanirhabdus sp. W0125-5]|uniref:helix-turn-helix domain-containing protein n=1 Tax=Oceanirhabdus sp. W0125-5 TaxID=2999116 RepID=UPI0022F2AA02|nr:helix-turn-helix domain-containing protein [Oceanirhabdus sp. W0125-5]WBW96701.1 helix-turn-helix domain-containing protein [Oceanirhabdus sp. W0125-5]
MDSQLLNCILHPIRMRIVQSLMKNRSMTVQQIAKELPDVPQATLYRHLNKLLKVSAITVIKENRVRGAVEKVYAIDPNPYKTVKKDFDLEEKNQCLNLFYNFLMILLGDFERYIHTENPDLEKDGVTFKSVAMYLSDEEYNEFMGDLIKAFDKVRDNGTSPERKLRKITTITMPTIYDNK